MPEESTTPDLPELAQRLVASTNARDFDAVTSSYAPDAILEHLGLVFEGRSAIRGLYEDWWRAYEDHQQEVEEVRDLGNGVIFVVILQRAHLPDTTGALQNRYAAVAILGDGLIARHTNYQDIDEGRAAAERLAEERG
ncbi:MAG: nuclear transport factor 2 family protein [Solirubrobacteraceae bacterium]